MPTRTLKHCAEPGCGALVAKGRCARHRVTHEHHRCSSAARGYGGHHRRWRVPILRRDRICRLCHAAPSTEADHIIPLSRGGTWALENGQGLCKRCHGQKTRRDRGGENQTEGPPETVRAFSSQRAKMEVGQ